MKNLFVLLISVILAGLFTGCQNTTSEDIAVTIAEDEVGYILAEDALGEEITAASFGGQLATSDSKTDCIRFFPYKNFPDCAEVTISGTDYPKEIVIDFGEECLTRNGRLRSGTIYITITDDMTNAGAEYSVVYEDVVFGNRAIDKVSTVVNEGENDLGHWVMSYQTVCTVTYGDTLKVMREYSGEKEWLEGFLTPEYIDNKFLLTGGGTITVNDDLVFERTIIEPLYIDRTCRFILSGVVQIVKDGEVMTIDFGDGECDSIAVVTKGDISEEIDLTTGRFRMGFSRTLRHIYRVHGWW